MVEYFRGNINEHMKCKIFMLQNVPLFIKMKIFTAKSSITSTKKIPLLYQNTSRSRAEFMFKAILAPVYSGQPFGLAPRPGPTLRNLPNIKILNNVYEITQKLIV